MFKSTTCVSAGRHHGFAMVAEWADTVEDEMGL